MNYLTQQIVFREIPDEISFSYLVTGCDLRCPGCHSADSWLQQAGQTLSQEKFHSDLSKYQSWITCVLFMGGEWHENELIELLKIARQYGLKTALYSGREAVSEKILCNLDYVKLGSYKKELGGLDSARSNQRLIKVSTGQTMNSFFLYNTEEIL